MANFEWSGIGRNGQSTGGTITADSADAVSQQLRRKRIRVTKVQPVKSGFSLFKKKSKVSHQAVSVFTRQFSVMIDAGLPLVQCLDILSKQADDEGFGRILDQVRGEMEGGANLADALRQHPQVFTDLYCNMVAAGEAGGILDIILGDVPPSVELRRR